MKCNLYVIEDKLSHQCSDVFPAPSNEVAKSYLINNAVQNGFSLDNQVLWNVGLFRSDYNEVEDWTRFELCNTGYEPVLISSGEIDSAYQEFAKNNPLQAENKALKDEIAELRVELYKLKGGNNE